MNVILIGLAIGVACGSLAFLSKGSKSSEIDAPAVRLGNDYYEMVRGSFRALRMANEGVYENRMALMNLSTAIIKMEAGEDVPLSVLVMILRDLNGGCELLAKIKGEGA